MLTKKALEKLFEIVQSDYGKSFSEEEINKIANDIVDYFSLLLKIKQENDD
ncbi:MAG: hypothetical protein PHO28_01995 [Candidatus Pacebacteria bacterium]|nr:hypothetical protein [Candidatus Paceibacterota bacterium]